MINSNDRMRVVLSQLEADARSDGTGGPGDEYDGTANSVSRDFKIDWKRVSSQKSLSDIFSGQAVPLVGSNYVLRSFWPRIYNGKVFSLHCEERLFQETIGNRGHQYCERECGKPEHAISSEMRGAAFENPVADSQPKHVVNVKAVRNFSEIDERSILQEFRVPSKGADENGGAPGGN